MMFLREYKMLLEINNIYINTDYPEQYIEQVKTLLPFPLSESVADKLKEYNNFPNKLEEVEKEISINEHRLDYARDTRDKAQDLIDNVIENISDKIPVNLRKDLIRALNFIRDKLDNI